MKLRVGQAAIDHIGALPDAQDAFRVTGHINGQVHVGKDLIKGDEVAIKIYEVKNLTEDLAERISAEILISKEATGRTNINKFRGAFLKKGKKSPLVDCEVALMMDYCNGGSLQDFTMHLRDAAEEAKVPVTDASMKILDENTIAYLMKQIVQAIADLHKAKLVHRDIKGGNVMITKGGHAVLVDFDTCTPLTKALCKEKHFHAVGTPYWCSPEMAACNYPEGYTYDERCDVWSAGITAIEIAEGQAPLYKVVEPLGAFDLILKNPSPALTAEHWSEKFRDFVAKCLVKDYEKRTTAASLLKHPFLKSIDALAARAVIMGHPHMRMYREVKFNSELGGMEDNLATSDNLTVEYILNTLRNRFKENLIYTHVGDILIAVNPYKQLTCYNADAQQKFSLDAPVTASEPHVFGMALHCFKSLVNEHVNQSCVISGESGAGKTETSKYFLSHLLELSRGGDTGLASQYAVMQFAINELLESFGNARTRINDNSSRFGKYIEISFDNSNHAVGAKLYHYLLEKSRVVHQAANERNFHIFYQLLAGLSSARKFELFLGGSSTVADYAYINGGITPLKKEQGAEIEMHLNVPDARETFLKVEEEVKRAGFADEEWNDVLKTLALILNLGNIDFDQFTEENARAAHFFDLAVDGPLADCAKLHGCSTNDMGSALTSTVIVTRGETIFKSNTVVSARDARDAMAKGLYGRLFSWLVNRVNDALDSPKRNEDKTVGLLDIFGFENLEENSLEQLCINVTNENLQSFFNEHVFAWQQKELEREGLDVSVVTFENNDGLINLFLGAPLGIFNLVDEESRFPGASSQSLIEKLNKHCKANEVYVPSLTTKASVFGIRHVAGQIDYTVDGWIEKNRDTITPSVLSLLRESGNPLIKLLYSTSESATGGLVRHESTSDVLKRQENAREMMSVLRRSIWTRRGKNDAVEKQKEKRNSRVALSTVGRVDSIPSLPLSKTIKQGPSTLCSHFKASLLELVLKLRNTRPNFIRCIQPNTVQRDTLWEGDHVERQLRYTGVLQTVQIRQQGYSSRFSFEEFLERYRPVKYKFTEKLSDTKAACKGILETIEDCAPGDWQLGHHKVFLKYSVVNALLAKLEVVNNMGSRITRMVRRYLFWHRLRRFVRNYKAELARIEEEERKRREEEERKQREEEERRQREEDERRRREEADRRRKHEEEQKRRREQAERERVLRERREREQLTIAADSVSTDFVSTVISGAVRKASMMTIKRKKTAASTEIPDDEDTTKMTLRSRGKREEAPQARRSVTKRSSMRGSKRGSKKGRVDDGPIVEETLKRYKGSNLFPSNMGPLLSKGEFASLPLNLASLDEIPEDALALCRYKNVLPNKHSRVRLSHVPIPGDTDVYETSFINANWMRNWKGRRRYIATQGPKPETVDHFWRLVWESGSPLVVMATSLIEAGKLKCHRYWPEFSGGVGQELVSNVMDLPCGMRVELMQIERFKDFSVGHIRLLFDKSEKFVSHMYLDNWPDYGVPKSTRSLLGVMDYIRDSLRRAKRDGRAGPPIVHCSAGIGRTGIIIATMIGIECLEKAKQVHLPAIINSLRHDRGGTVQTYEQFLFIYKALGAYARRLAFINYFLSHANKQHEITQQLVPILSADPQSLGNPPPAHPTPADVRRARLERFCEFIDREQPEMALGFPDESAFAPGWHLVEDAYSVEAVQSGDIVAMEGDGTHPDVNDGQEHVGVPFLKLAYFDDEDTIATQKNITEPIFRIKDDDSRPYTLSLSQYADVSADYVKNLDDDGLIVLTDPRDGDVYVFNNTTNPFRIRGLESSVATWTPGFPGEVILRCRCVHPGEYMRIFNSDSLRFAFSRVYGATIDSGLASLEHVLEMCFVDIFLDKGMHKRGTLRIYYRAAAAEMARVFDSISKKKGINAFADGDADATVVSMLGDEQWRQLHSQALETKVLRVPMPTNSSTLLGAPVVPFDPPYGTETIYAKALQRVNSASGPKRPSDGDASRSQTRPGHVPLPAIPAPALSARKSATPTPAKATEAPEPVPEPPKAVVTSTPKKDETAAPKFAPKKPFSLASALAEVGADDGAESELSRVFRRRRSKRDTDKAAPQQSEGVEAPKFEGFLRRTSQVKFIKETAEVRAAAIVLQSTVRGFLSRKDRAGIKSERKRSYVFFEQLEANQESVKEGEEKVPKFKATRRNTKQALLKQKISERERPTAKNTAHLEAKVEKATILQFKRPPKRVKRKATYVKHPYSPYTNNDGENGICEEGFSPNVFKPEQCKNCGFTHPLRVDVGEPEKLRRDSMSELLQRRKSVVLGEGPPAIAEEASEGDAPHAEAESDAVIHEAPEEEEKDGAEAEAKDEAEAPKAVDAGNDDDAMPTEADLVQGFAPEPEGAAEDPQEDVEAPPPPPPPPAPPVDGDGSAQPLDQSVASDDADPSENEHVTPLPQRKLSRRKSSLLSRLSFKRKNSKKRKRKSSASSSLANEDPLDEDDEGDGSFDLGMDEATMALFRQLEENEKKRAAEAANRRAELREQMAAQREKELAELQVELDAIEEQKKKEEEAEERKKDAFIAESQERLQGITFNFSFD